MRQNLKRVGIILSITANMAFLGGYCYNKIPSRFPERSHWEGFRLKRELLKELRLSPQQEKEIRSSISQLKEEVSETRNTLRKRRLEMLELLSAGDIDRETVEAKRREIAQLQQQIQKMIVDQLIENKEILTSEQQEKLFSFLRKRLEKNLR